MTGNRTFAGFAGIVEASLWSRTRLRVVFWHARYHNVKPAQVQVAACRAEPYQNGKNIKREWERSRW